jgi:hypothetical protein
MNRRLFLASVISLAAATPILVGCGGGGPIKNSDPLDSLSGRTMTIEGNSSNTQKNESLIAEIEQSGILQVTGGLFEIKTTRSQSVSQEALEMAKNAVLSTNKSILEGSLRASSDLTVYSTEITRANDTKTYYYWWGRKVGLNFDTTSLITALLASGGLVAGVVPGGVPVAVVLGLGAIVLGHCNRYGTGVYISMIGNSTASFWCASQPR